MPAIIPNPVKEKKKKKKGSQSAQAGGSTTDVAAAAAAPKPVVLGKKTGLPAGILHEKPKKPVEMDEDVEAPPPLSCKRRRDETREEKKLRKQAIKEHRRDRRVEKKANKQHFVHKRKAESVASKAVEGIRM
eukprot:scpid81997/ scgid15527/ 